MPSCMFIATKYVVKGVGQCLGRNEGNSSTHEGDGDPAKCHQFLAHRVGSLVKQLREIGSVVCCCCGLSRYLCTISGPASMGRTPRS